MNTTVIVRAVRLEDLGSVLQLAKVTGPGFNSLPDDQNTVMAKIMLSVQSFSEKIEPKKRYYFFVMEDVEKSTVVGTAAIEAAVGYPWPFYKYKLSTIMQVSQSLNKWMDHKVLYLVSDHEGATELASLFLMEAYRGEGRGLFLSRARCLFISEFPALFSDLVVADMRGVSDGTGISPFWDAIGPKFFGMTYKEASLLKATGGSQFMMELMPRYPIYVDLLPDGVQKVLGNTHVNATPALYMLKKEGLRFRNNIDIFDGGPAVESSKDMLKTVRESKSAIVHACTLKEIQGPLMLISNTTLDFRVAQGTLTLMDEDKVILEEKIAKLLNVEVGDKIRFTSIR